MTENRMLLQLWKAAFDTQWIIDVRSPAEYAKGHVPEAISLPLFSDDERAVIGTLYKQCGHQHAFAKGLELVAPKLSHILRTLTDLSTSRSIVIYCWRGGQRSASVTWLSEQAQVRATQMPGGYKSYRRICHQLFSDSLNLNILGGSTGVGKTKCLITMKKEGHQVIDLEALACHTGSVFGDALEPNQPSQEHFENLLGRELMLLDLTRNIWLEDESRFIGKLMIPPALFCQMQQAPITMVEQALDQRLDNLCALYGNAGAVALCHAIDRIAKRLGSQRTKEIKLLIESGALRAAAKELLHYYDKAYQHATRNRKLLACNTICRSHNNAHQNVAL